MRPSEGRHFLQVPGPTNVPDRILAAMSAPTIDHRGPGFAALALEVIEGTRHLFASEGPVLIFPGSGTGGWEAALVNTCSPGDRVLMFETGHFATLWCAMARAFGLEVDFVAGDWRTGIDPDLVRSKLAEDRGHDIKAVCVVHNETSTGVTSRLAEIGKAIAASGHPALLMADVVSSLGATAMQAAEWGIDVAIGGSQKGLMLPPGLAFNAVSERALAAAASARLPRAFWDWGPVLAANKSGMYPYTPATNLLFGLSEALRMLDEEGLDSVFARHQRHGEATRRAVGAWGLEIQASDASEHSASVTAVVPPAGHDADRVRGVILEHFNMSLGAGLGKLAGKVFRIGHLGAFNDLMLAGTLSGVEMGLAVAGVPHRKGGVQAALDYLAAHAGDEVPEAAENAA